jgi:hypothetical protein
MLLQARLSALLLTCTLVLISSNCLALQAQRDNSQPATTANAPANAAPGVSNDQAKRNSDSKEKVTPDAKLGLIGALAGAIIGGAIAWFAGIKTANRAAVLTELHDKKIEGEEAATVRAMLDVEIEMNLQMLRDEQARLQSQPEDVTAFEWLALHPSPQWSTVVWERSVLRVHHALSKSEILNVQKLYNSLHSMTVAREAAVRVIERGQHYEARVSFNRAKELMNGVLANGNPLRPPV